MSKIFKPRRGTTYAMTSTDKRHTVLAKGEFFLEVPNTGPGTGVSKIKIGDGITTYENLPTALSGTTTSDVTSSTASTVASALSGVVSGKERSILFGNLKRAVDLNRSAVETLKSKVPFSLAIRNGEYGYIKSDGTFKSFSSDQDIEDAMRAVMIGNATRSDVLSGYTFTNSSSSGLSGSMTNNGNWSRTIDPNSNITISEGYHSGSGKVTANLEESYLHYEHGDYKPKGETYYLADGNLYRHFGAVKVYKNGFNEGKIPVIKRVDRIWTHPNLSVLNEDNNAEDYVTHGNNTDLERFKKHADVLYDFKNIEFTGQVISLSKPITDYYAIRIVYAPYTKDDSGSDNNQFIVNNTFIRFQDIFVNSIPVGHSGGQQAFRFTTGFGAALYTDYVGGHYYFTDLTYTSPTSSGTEKRQFQKAYKNMRHIRIQYANNMNGLEISSVPTASSVMQNISGGYTFSIPGKYVNVPLVIYGWTRGLAQ